MELLSLSLVSCPPVHSKGEVSLNGKKIKAYSGLRPELQHLARLAKEKIAVKGSCQDPLTIAQELTQELIDAPVTMVIEGEDETRVRISSFMSDNAAEVAKLRKYVEDSLDLPLSMHDAMSASLKSAVNKSLALVDFLSGVVQKNVEMNLPARWLSFAIDVSDYYATTGGFAPGCAEALGSGSGGRRKKDALVLSKYRLRL